MLVDSKEADNLADTVYEIVRICVEHMSVLPAAQLEMPSCDH